MAFTEGETEDYFFFFSISIIRISHLNFYVRQIKTFEIHV